MLTKNQQLWVDALRSGEYRQTRGCLQDSHGYCCLGVACRVYEKHTGDKLVEDRFGHLSGFDLSGYLAIVKNWLQLHGEEGELTHLIDYSQVEFISLTYKNDHDNLNFNQLADYIEENQDQLFLKANEA